MSIGRIRASSCRCCMFVSAVHPVAVLSAEFCITWSLFMCVSAVDGDQMVLAYSKSGLVIALYVVTSVSFCFPHLVEVSDLIILSVLFALVWVFLMCSAKVSCGSKVRPRFWDFVPWV